MPLAQEDSSFPYSWNFKDSFTLDLGTTLTSNYTLFLINNKASFLATFKESTTGEILELDGTWTGLFFNILEEKSVIDEID